MILSWEKGGERREMGVREGESGGGREGRGGEMVLGLGERAVGLV